MPIVASSAGRARPNQFSSLQTRVAQIVGGQNDSTIKASCGEYINDAIDEFNTRLYECNKLGPTAITVTGGSADLPTQFYKEEECQVVDSAGNKLREISYIDWTEYQKVFNFGSYSSGPGPAPQYYTLFNTHLTGQIKLLPAPAATATTYLKITYYKRFDQLASESDILDAPRELQLAIILKAQATALRILRSGEPQLYTQADAIAERAWMRFAMIDRRHPDMKPRFRLAPLTTNRGPFDGDITYVRG